MNDKLVNELNDPNVWDQFCYPDIQRQLMYHIILTNGHKSVENIRIHMFIVSYLLPQCLLISYACAGRQEPAITQFPLPHISRYTTSWQAT